MALTQDALHGKGRDLDHLQTRVQDQLQEIRQQEIRIQTQTADYEDRVSRMTGEIQTLQEQLAQQRDEVGPGLWIFTHIFRDLAEL